MKNLITTLAFLICPLLLGACPDSGGGSVEPALYDYSSEEELDHFVDDGMASINAAVDCNLVGAKDPGPYVNDIVVIDSHWNGPGVVGCAWLGEALQRKEDPRDIYIVRRAIDADYGLLVYIHEIGHTLGLPHIPRDQEGIMNPVVSDTLEWHPDSVARLQSLCDAEPEVDDEDTEQIIDSL